jgi:hypothetical protein
VHDAVDQALSEVAVSSGCACADGKDVGRHIGKTPLVAGEFGSWVD